MMTTKKRSALDQRTKMTRIEREKIYFWLMMKILKFRVVKALILRMKKKIK